MNNRVLSFVAFSLACFFLTGCFRSVDAKEQEIVRYFTDLTYKGIDRNKQAIFNRIHPMGQVSSAEVNALAVTEWRNGERTGNWKDVVALEYVYTLHWDSPLISNGYTRIHSRFDFTVGKHVSTRIVDTNGLTNSDMSDMAQFLGAVVGFAGN